VKEVIADHITPLVTNPGRLMLTSSRLYFQPFNNATMVHFSFNAERIQFAALLRGQHYILILVVYGEVISGFVMPGRVWLAV